MASLKDIHKIHFVGIGGVGMSALARILAGKGYIVSGSDLKVSHLTTGLQASGVKVYQGHAKEHVQGAEAVVYSSAIDERNPEIAAAKSEGIPLFHRSDINAFLLNQARGVAVAGAHGKTTTTAMIGVVLDHAGLSPTVIVGGEVDYFGSNAQLGMSDIVVTEADESDGSFLKLRPHFSVVTNVEDDHLDHYGTMENIRKAFLQFIESTDEDGCAVLCMDNENLRELATKTSRRVLRYAIQHDADYRAGKLRLQGAGASFAVLYQRQELGEIHLAIPGKHNVLNALATVAVCREIGLPFEKIAEGLAQFHGAMRRFQTKGRVKGIWVVDDYAHHPTEIQMTLAAAKETGVKRVICAFQPHRYTRTKLLQAEFGNAFTAADVLILTDIYAAGESPIPGISGKTLVEAIEKATGKAPTYIAKREDVAPYLQQIARAGDLILTMGAGDIWQSAEALVKNLEA